MRRAAASALHAVTALGQPLDSALAACTQRFSAPDQALARALSAQALRHLVGIDALIDAATLRPLPADARARQVLRVALAGHYRLGTPPHAVIATALPLLEGGPRRLLHGVLSTILRQGEPLPPPALPPSVAARWEAAWGPGAVRHAAASLAAIPPTDLALADPAEGASLAALLPAVSLFSGHLRLAADDARPVSDLPGFAEGRWWVQDAAAQLPARLLGPLAGLSVLDLCAAPGGKTMQLAAAGARVTAVDQSARRLRLLAENLARTGLAAEIVAADALQWQPAAPFDAILLDAPCSASGTFRRHPDVLWRNAGRPPDRLLALQSALLARAAGWLKPGGRLVYAVCSLEPEEGRPAVPSTLVAEPIGRSELPPGLSPAADGGVVTLPGLWAAQGGADGFQVARFRRA